MHAQLVGHSKGENTKKEEAARLFAQGMLVKPLEGTYMSVSVLHNILLHDIMRVTVFINKRTKNYVGSEALPTSIKVRR